MVGRAAVFAVPMGFIPTGEQGWARAVSGKHVRGQEEMALVLSTAQLGTVPGDDCCCPWSSAALTWGCSALGGWGLQGSAPHPGSVIPRVTQPRGGEVSERQRGFYFQDVL